MNDLYDPWNEPVVSSFLVHGHTVDVINPMTLRITVEVPWKGHVEPDFHQKTYVMNAVEGILQYMVAEDLVGGKGLSIQVLTHHK